VNTLLLCEAWHIHPEQAEQTSLEWWDRFAALQEARQIARGLRQAVEAAKQGR
jgi:hypothetical protein